MNAQNDARLMQETYECFQKGDVASLLVPCGGGTSLSHEMIVMSSAFAGQPFARASQPELAASCRD
jgi:hypothetical protein